MKKVLIIGCGSRALEMFIKPFIEDSFAIRIAAICDVNRKRMDYIKEIIPYQIECYLNLSEIKNISIFDYCIITTKDKSHAEIILKIAAMGIQVICEKPIAINLEQCKELLVKKNLFNNVKIAFNSRYMPINKVIKQVLNTKEIGRILLVNYNWFINKAHGVEYFRRWHRRKEESGGLLVHKSCHHFDLVNWWLNDYPIEVQAMNTLTEFGSRNIKGKNCRTCENKCKYRMLEEKNKEFEELYFKCEVDDNYYRDSCVYDSEIDVADTMCVNVKYKNGELLNYSLNMLAEMTGWNLEIIGTEGEIKVCYQEANNINSINIMKENRVKKIEVIKQNTKHEGADVELRNYLFSNNAELKLDIKEGINSVIIGILAEISNEKGIKINIEDYVEEWYG